DAKKSAGVTSDAALSASSLKALCETFKSVVKAETGKEFPQEPVKQLRGAVEAVFRSWNGARAIAYRVREKISHDLGTAVNVQAMVFGNRDNNSGTGVGFTRNAATGENKP
ncbi:MAG: PEP/pyruvate-binding domain-containing protein, partial [bacterium]